MLTHVEASGPPDDDPAGVRDAHEVNIWRDDEGRMLARACVSGVRRWIDWIGVGRFSFDLSSRSVTIQRVPGVSDAFLSDIFHRHVRPLVLQALGFQVLHAGAVVIQDRVVVLAGFAHSGKSTLAHAIGRAGHPQFADDSVVIDARRLPVLAHGLSFSSRLRPPSRTFFDAPDRRADVHTELAGAVRTLAAIVLLTQSEFAEVPRLRRLRAADALRMTMLHANGFDSVTPAERRRTLGDYLTITQSVPVFDLTYRPNFAELPALVSTVVGTVAEHAEARP